jgi:hypothetical protein
MADSSWSAVIPEGIRRRVRFPKSAAHAGWTPARMAAASETPGRCRGAANRATAPKSMVPVTRDFSGSAHIRAFKRAPTPPRCAPIAVPKMAWGG